MDQIQFLERIKKLVIIAMFSDDELMQHLVLKGGNLLDVVFGIGSRGSMDLDFSIESEFETVAVLKGKLSRALSVTFGDDGYVVFDVNISEVPPGLSPEMKSFWGGYKVDFKIIEKEKFAEFENDLVSLRKRARVLGKAGSPKFKIDISKYEYCGGKQRRLFDGYTIYTYSPEMVVAEKMRAICQQMPDYVKVVKSHPSARARDFVDIHRLIEHYSINLEDGHFHEILRNIFAIKRVPLALLGKIGDFRDYHRPDFAAVQATVKPNVQLRDFDFYFDFLAGKIRDLESVWNV